MYFFETNTIRSLGSDLFDFEFKTSHLCLVELLTGMKNEKEFSIRKKCLARIKEAKCIIDPLLPEFKLFAAFGFNIERKNQKLFNNTWSLIEHLLDIDKFGQFVETSHMKLLTQYDVHASSIWRKELTERTNSRKRAYSFKENSNEFDLKWDSITNKSDYLSGYTNYYSKILKRRDISGDNRTLNQIANDYDDSINNYFLAMGFYVDDKVLNNNLPDRNDYIDINHLLYLEDEDILVTNDKLIHKLYKVLDYRESVITIEELKENN